MSFRGLIVLMQKDRKRWRNPHKTNPTILVHECVFFFVTGHNSLPLGKLILCRTMGTRSKFCACLYTLFQIYGFLSCLSHSIKQAPGLATVKRVLPCHEYKRTVSKDAKGLGWWHWDTEGKPSFDSSCISQFSPFPQTSDSRRRVALWAELLTKAPCKLAVPHDTSRHACSWMLGPALNSGCGLWQGCETLLRSLALCSIRCASGRNIKIFNTWQRVLWTEHQLCQPGLIN